ncbi:ABC transporter permease [Lacrimispora sp. NSJ-141]|uniref:ABC transporter permease n=1 Tax=Lientehia hominis TaxID=2897778 RepID=A0AAP2RJ27_9FIRM|nr:FtsX-like permease family protein [Lientehia hominis]MCD2492349.1 ABC transporter permease [Lientehia hominis]
MEVKILLKAGIKQHRGVLAGIFVLVLLVSLFLGTVLTVWTNSGSYMRHELNRAGFGGLTAWVSGAPDVNALAGQAAALHDVERVEVQRLIFSNYITNGQESDSEGQLISVASGDRRYRFFTDDLTGYLDELPEIATGEVYVSPSLISMFDVKIGDAIDFPLARNGGTVSLTVTGFYEDPFMGSSMIGMKSFLISGDEADEMLQVIQNAGIDALARSGAMLHLFQREDSTAAIAELNGSLNENTSLPEFTEFVHSSDAVSGFMLILQNAFCGLLLAFVLVLLFVVFAVLGHSIASAIEADTVRMGVLKTAGFTSSMLRRIQLLQYAAAILPGMLLGILLTRPASRLVSSATITTTGLRVPADVPLGLCLGAFAAILLLLAAFILLKTARISRIMPMKAIRGDMERSPFRPEKWPAVNGENLSISLAVRQLATGRRKYLSACVTAILLVFFVSMIVRMNAWLGADGKGMMDAFNPADHDIGIQSFGELTREEMERMILEHTGITDTYVLAMPGVTVNGVDFTANVIDEPERFHLMEGRTCLNGDEIVITEFVAADLGVAVGDSLTVGADLGIAEYVVSGIYSCANDMGQNVGMSREGYLKIGYDSPNLWCRHYFLADSSKKVAITGKLEAAYGGDVHIHENTWPGLFGIISAMEALLSFLYIIVVFFILVVTVMTGSRILSAERRDTGIYKAVGVTDRRLRISFSLRFGIAALAGSIIGAALASVFTDPLVSAVMKLAGISTFASRLDAASALLPVVAVVTLFAGFAYLAAGRIKRTDLTILITE